MGTREVAYVAAMARYSDNMGEALMQEDKRRLLVIDDSEIVLAYQASLLSTAGFDVRAVTSLRSFQQVLATWKPHLIVTDLQMPEMHGIELCKWLRAQVATARIPIVLCSSASDEELEEIAKEVGADAYCSKQDGLEMLPERLTTLCDEILW